jgi:hypothetical protein
MSLGMATATIVEAIPATARKAPRPTTICTWPLTIYAPHDTYMNAPRKGEPPRSRPKAKGAKP